MKLQTSYNNGILTLLNLSDKNITNLHITFYNLENKKVKNDVMLYFRNKFTLLAYTKYLVYELDNIPPRAVLNYECNILNNVEATISYDISNNRNIKVYEYISKIILNNKC